MTTCAKHGTEREWPKNCRECDQERRETFRAQQAQHKAEKERLRATLAEWNLDGPHEIHGGGFLPMSYAYAICLTCGATVMLNDREELVEGMWTERGVRIHTAWHARNPAQPEG